MALVQGAPGEEAGQHGLRGTADNRNLKDLWAVYRKKEVQMECQITGSKPIEIQPEGVEMESDVKSASLEAEQIGDKLVKVHFIEYIGKSCPWEKISGIVKRRQ